MVTFGELTWKENRRKKGFCEVWGLVGTVKSEKEIFYGDTVLELIERLFKLLFISRLAKGIHILTKTKVQQTPTSWS